MRSVAVAAGAIIVMGSIAKYSGYSEARARDSMAEFIQENNIEATHKTCVGYGDGYGYGSCTIVTSEGEDIHLQCPSGVLRKEVFGNTGCKEVGV